jgi:predicted nucleic acid-binding protein
VLAVDTNVLAYAADADSQFHTDCRNWLERQRARRDAWYTTWAILYEFLRVTTHARVMRRPWSASAAWNFVAALLASPDLSPHEIVGLVNGLLIITDTAAHILADPRYEAHFRKRRRGGVRLWKHIGRYLSNFTFRLLRRGIDCFTIRVAFGVPLGSVRKHIESLDSVVIHSRNAPCSGAMVSLRASHKARARQHEKRARCHPRSRSIGAAAGQTGHGGAKHRVGRSRRHLGR